MSMKIAKLWLFPCGKRILVVVLFVVKFWLFELVDCDFNYVKGLLR